MPPRSVLYDPELTLALPASLTRTSGINAIAHAVEALYAPDTSPIIGLFAKEGMPGGCPALYCGRSTDRAGGSLALRGAWLCGVCLGATTMSLHHKLCHVLGGTFDLPHARTHAVILPYVAAFNLPAAPSTRVALCRALRTDDPAGVLTDRAAAVGAARSLAELGAARAPRPSAAYVAFVVDAYARRIRGWRVASTMATSMVLDAIEQAIWTRQQEGVMDLKDVVHHTDRGSQYTSIRFSERLAEAGIQPSVGAVGSSYETPWPRRSTACTRPS